MIPVLALSLSAAACGGGSGGPTGEDSANSFSVNIVEPENPLIPGNTGETAGGQVVDALWTGLVTYNSESNEAEFNGVAESIESEDQTTWTITLKDGWTFHDGTPVTAQSYVDAWNYTALSTNAQSNSYFFENVEGYDALQAETDDEDNIIAEPTATEMTGLQVIDDTTFEVTLKQPFAQYPITTGYTAFFPLPESFFNDPEAFGTQPVGNGPFMATEPFQPGRGITLTRYEEFGGDEPAAAQGVEFRVYTDVNAAYTDVQAGNLDIISLIPPDAVTTAPDEFGDRYLERPRGDITSLGFPTFNPAYSVEVRQAISMAIDREAITEAIFNGTRTPASSFISPVVDGYREDACSTAQFNPDMARQLIEQSGFTGPVELWFNGGQGHEEWMQAVGNQIRENLGLEFVLRGDLQFAEYRPLGASMGFTGPHRAGWVMDYPSPQSFLEPLYSSAAIPPTGSSNDFFYSSPEFDSLIGEANAAADNDAAIEGYNRAEDVLCQDMPATPLFYGVNQSVHTERVDNVVVNAFSRIEVAGVEVEE